MRVVILSDWGGSLGMAQRLMTEGHTVQMFIRDPNAADVGEGVVEKVTRIGREATSADLVVADDIGFGEQLETLRKQGATIWGGSAYSDRLESDRAFGQRELRDAGMCVLASETFEEFRSAAHYIAVHPGRYVFKPDGRAQEDKILTYVGQRDDGSDMLAFIEQISRSYAKNSMTFELQQFVSGVEVGVSGFFNGHDFVEPIEVSFEHKPLMTGNIGPATGEMGTTMFWTNKKSKLYRETIGKIVTKLQGYVGYININCIADKRVIYPLEFTTRFGYPTLYLHLETITGDWGSTMLDIAQGRDVEVQTSSPVAMCIVVATPPWPYSSKEVFQRYSADTIITVEGSMEGKLPQGVWPVEVKFVHGSLMVAGDCGYNFVVTGSGESLEEAQRMAYHRLSCISIPNMMYRTDIGFSWNEDLAKLRQWGWIH